MPISMTVRGNDQLRRNLAKLRGRERLDAQRRGLEAGARIVESWAKVNTTPNVDTGALRASIMVDEVTPVEAIIAPHTEYAEHLEFGTMNMQAYPYMRPALDEHEQEIIAAVEAQVEAFVNSVRA
jgi:HK97 gp10 family phage protein